MPLHKFTSHIAVRTRASDETDHKARRVKELRGFRQLLWGARHFEFTLVGRSALLDQAENSGVQIIERLEDFVLGAIKFFDQRRSGSIDIHSRQAGTKAGMRRPKVGIGRRQQVGKCG